MKQVNGNGNRLIKRVMIGIIGGTVLLIGIVLIVLPGPAMLVIPAGLAILATEFIWARRWLNRSRAAVNHLKEARKEGLSWSESLKRSFSRARAKSAEALH